jgi:hypothetical protein
MELVVPVGGGKIHPLPGPVIVVSALKKSLIVLNDNIKYD